MLYILSTEIESFKSIPKVKETPQEKVIFQVVEEMPEFPGGMAEAMKFLAKNIKYPVYVRQPEQQNMAQWDFVYIWFHIL